MSRISTCCEVATVEIRSAKGRAASTSSDTTAAITLTGAGNSAPGVSPAAGTGSGYGTSSGSIRAITVDGNVTSPPSRNNIVALSASRRQDLTDMVRPFLKTTMSARADTGKNKEQKTKNANKEGMAI